MVDVAVTAESAVPPACAQPGLFVGRRDGEYPGPLSGLGRAPV